MAFGYFFSGDPPGKLEGSFCCWLTRAPPDKINNPAHSAPSAQPRNTFWSVLQYFFICHDLSLTDFAYSQVHDDLSALALSCPLSHPTLTASQGQDESEASEAFAWVRAKNSVVKKNNLPMQHFKKISIFWYFVHYEFFALIYIFKNMAFMALKFCPWATASIVLLSHLSPGSV